MSKLSELRNSVTTLANSKGGSHATKEARMRTAADFAATMYQLGYQIRSSAQIRVKHLQAYSQSLIERGLSPRTIANRLSHIRAALSVAGKSAMIKESAAQNKSLGASGGSRIGTKTAMPNDKFAEIKAALSQKGEAFAAIAELQRALGLRQQEALRGANVDTLTQWKNQLANGYAEISLGTKGGRNRETIVHGYERALNAVNAALAIAERNGRYALPDNNYKQALDTLNNAYRAAGMKGVYSSHSLRYAWAREQMSQYRDLGLTERQARSELSKDLGHGDGRGRYVAMVYLR